MLAVCIRHLCCPFCLAFIHVFLILMYEFAFPVVEFVVLDTVFYIVFFWV